MQQQLARRNDKGWLEPMIFEPGKAAVLNIKGPYVLYRDGLGVTSVKQIQPLIKVSSAPCLHSLCSATWLPLGMWQEKATWLAIAVKPHGRHEFCLQT